MEVTSFFLAFYSFMLLLLFLSLILSPSSSPFESCASIICKPRAHACSMHKDLMVLPRQKFNRTVCALLRTEMQIVSILLWDKFSKFYRSELWIYVNHTFCNLSTVWVLLVSFVCWIRKTGDEKQHLWGSLGMWSNVYFFFMIISMPWYLYITNNSSTLIKYFLFSEER